MQKLIKRVDGLVRLGRAKPLWFDTIQTNPPLSFKNHPIQNKKSNGSSRIKPPKLVYPEDRLRIRFYRDHPFELDTPLSLNPNYPTPIIDPEWTIQRQLQLIENGMKENSAYLQACQEFEQRKSEREVAERLARQEQLQVQRETLKPLSQLLDSVFMDEKRELEYKNNNNK